MKLSSNSEPYGDRGWDQDQNGNALWLAMWKYQTAWPIIESGIVYQNVMPSLNVSFFSCLFFSISLL